MIQTCYAVREFEPATDTNQAEMLSQLVHRYSNPLAVAANQITSRAFSTYTNTSASFSSSCSFANNSKSKSSFCGANTTLGTTNTSTNANWNVTTSPTAATTSTTTYYCYFSQDG
jgi:hypothetical protein